MVKSIGRSRGSTLAARFAPTPFVRLGRRDDHNQACKRTKAKLSGYGSSDVVGAKETCQAVYDELFQAIEDKRIIFSGMGRIFAGFLVIKRFDRRSTQE